VGNHRIAVLHLRLKQMAKKSNLEVVRRLTRMLNSSAKILVLPSLFNTGPIFEHYRGHRLARVLKNAAEKIPGPTSDLLSFLAVEKTIFVLGGPIIERAGPRLFLTTLAFSPRGELICKYRKLVVDEEDEKLGISAGRTPGIVKFNINIGVLAGSDSLYPEVARALILGGASLLVALLRASRRQARLVDLLRLRSIENKVPLIIAGGISEVHGEAEAVVPTILYDENGREVIRVEDEYSRPVYMDLNPQWFSEKPQASRSTLRIIETLCRVMRSRKRLLC